MDINEIQKDFKYLDEGYIYLDSAATTQKPNKVIDSIVEYYTKYNGNPHSENMHYFSFKSTNILEEGRKKVAEFIGTNKNEIIFTKSSTESLNIAIFGLREMVKEGKILIGIHEHHANLVPYEVLKEENNLKIEYIYLNEDNTFNYEKFEKQIDKETRIIGLSLCSNVLGEELDKVKINEIIKRKKEEYGHEIYVILDISQSINHTKINIKNLDIYAASFSGHKMYAPLGGGVLYINSKYIDKVPPILYGGGMINLVYEDKFTLKEGPEKFEGGSPNVEAVYGLTKAIEYIENIGIENIEKYIKDLTIYAYKKLEEIPEVEIYSPKNAVSLISFNIKGIHSHDISSILNEDKICIRAGHHCAMPLHKKLCINSSMRVSFGIYNTKDDVDKLINSLKRAIDIFK